MRQFVYNPSVKKFHLLHCVEPMFSPIHDGKSRRIGMGKSGMEVYSVPPTPGIYLNGTASWDVIFDTKRLPTFLLVRSLGLV